MTRDHSQVEELITRGVLSREQARTFPGANAITRAVGVMERLELDSLSLKVLDGDSFLLCSDGLYNEVRPAGSRAHPGHGRLSEAAQN